MLVHCLAGIGRTGSFIALHNIIEQLNEVKKQKEAWDKLRQDSETMNYVESYESKFSYVDHPRISVFSTVRKLKE